MGCAVFVVVSVVIFFIVLVTGMDGLLTLVSCHGRGVLLLHLHSAGGWRGWAIDVDILTWHWPQVSHHLRRAGGWCGWAVDVTSHRPWLYRTSIVSTLVGVTVNVTIGEETYGYVPLLCRYLVRGGHLW